MDLWAVFLILFLTNFFTFGSSYVLIGKQLRHSEKQSDIEHRRALRADHTDRKREVRGEPLLRLRSELARMSGKMETIATYVHMSRKDRKQSESDRIIADELTRELFDYHKSGDWGYAIYQMDDISIINMAEEIEKDYIECVYIRVHSKESDEKQQANVAELLLKNKDRIAKIQSEINKRLEEL